MSTNIEISLILKALRENVKMNLHDFVMKSGISRAWVYKLEKGDVPSPSVLIVRKWVSTCKPRQDQPVEMAEWLRLSMLLIFDIDETSGAEVKPKPALEDDVKPVEPQKKGWIARVVEIAKPKAKL